jgi:hypothetical protein
MMVIFLDFTSCSDQSADVSEEYTACTFRLTKLVQVGIGHPDDGGSMFLCNVRTFDHYAV